MHSDQTACDALLMADQPSPARTVPTLVEVTGQPLELARYTAFVADPGAGAIATFTGTTRDTFQGKAVLRLEYEAYGPMAEKVMRVLRSLICDHAASQLCRIARADLFVYV